MPDYKVYIRQENVEKWSSIPNKSEWINSLLSSSQDAVVSPSKKPSKRVFTEVVNKSFTTPLCCKSARPCSHWSWDGTQQAYINSLNGEVRQAG